MLQLGNSRYIKDNRKPGIRGVLPSLTETATCPCHGKAVAPAPTPPSLLQWGLGLVTVLQQHNKEKGNPPCLGAGWAAGATSSSLSALLSKLFLLKQLCTR